MTEQIQQILMRRDRMSEQEAKELILKAKNALMDYLDEGDQEGAYNICEEFFGLEPDYLMELLKPL